MTSEQLRPAARCLARAAGAGLAGALLLGLLPGIQTAVAAEPAPATSAGDRLPPGRRVVAYTVRPGDTATELAVRFHAWTAELISFNDLGPAGRIYVGQRLRIPVVLAAVRKERRAQKAKQAKQARETTTRPKPVRKPQAHRQTHRQTRWVEPSRPQPGDRPADHRAHRSAP